MKYSSCGHVNLTNVDESTRLRGWIDSVRDHGGVIFIDLRDETGITQVVVESPKIKSSSLWLKDVGQNLCYQWMEKLEEDLMELLTNKYLQEKLNY